MPVESFLPFLLMKHLGSFAKNFVITENHLEYGFDPEMAFYDPRRSNKKKQSMMKEIKSEFIKPSDGSDPKAIQLIIDENAVNSYLLEFVMVETSLSIRQALAMDPRTRSAVNEMKTKYIGMLLPEITEEFGDDRNFDIMISLSHSLIKDQLEGQRVTGFNLDKNGNFRFTFNVYAQLLVEKSEARGQWQEARAFYIGLTFKGKILVEETNPVNKMMVIMPKTAELSSVKILDAAGEEKVVEQMMLTSAVNVQFEQALKLMRPLEYPMRNPPTPKEMECLGFKLSKANIDFRKGYLEFSCGYKMVREPSDPNLCNTFIDALRNGPKELLEKSQDIIANPKAFIEDRQKDLEEL